MSYAAMMVHLDLERDCEQRVQLALDLADRFQAALIGVAGLAPRPVFAAGGVATASPSARPRSSRLAGAFSSTKLTAEGKAGGRSLRRGQCDERAGVRTIAPIALGGGSRGKVVLAPLLVAADDANPLQVPHHR